MQGLVLSTSLRRKKDPKDRSLVEPDPEYDTKEERWYVDAE